MKGAGHKTRARDPSARADFSSAHHDHGSQLKAASAPNQSLAPQQMIHPSREATSATRMESERGNSRPRARTYAPIPSATRWLMERAAACCEKLRASFQITTTAAFTKIENVPYWNSPARLLQTHE